ncbi:MAG TPA: class I SAM-dependent methyltransferase [Vicinamibacterales bacterium]|jgi:SAM-dependent methyltransferase|nr:class I SAM-dependent methyltransferase [Vicinamibacterales bacterium]
MSESAPHVFSEAYYARLADIEERHWWAAGVRAIQQELLDRVAPESAPRLVLDAGCGTGLTLTWVRRYTNVEPTGLDRAAAGLAFCRSRGHRRLLQGDATTLPFPGHRFHLVLSCDVIQHLPRPDGDVRALAEMARVLAPGGYLLLRTNSRCGYPDDEPEPDYHRYTREELREKIEAAGLKIVRMSYANFLPALALTAWRRVSRHPVSGTDPGLGLQPRHSPIVRTILSGVLRAEGHYIASHDGSLPFGHSLIALAQQHL